jgi:hypothetical protein
VSPCGLPADRMARASGRADRAAGGLRALRDGGATLADLRGERGGAGIWCRLAGLHWAVARPGHGPGHCPCAGLVSSQTGVAGGGVGNFGEHVGAVEAAFPGGSHDLVAGVSGQPRPVRSRRIPSRSRSASADRPVSHAPTPPPRTP